MAVFCAPVVLSNNAAAPTAVLEVPLLRASAPPPTPVLKLPSMFEKSDRQPNAAFPAPRVLLMSASSPRNALKLVLSQPSWQTACAPVKNAKQANSGRMINKQHGAGGRFIGILRLLLNQRRASRIIVFMREFSRPERFSKYAELRTNPVATPRDILLKETTECIQHPSAIRQAFKFSPR